MAAGSGRARDRAELVTDDRNVLRERLEAATGERVSALEAVEPERTKAPKGGSAVDRVNETPETRKRERTPAIETEKVREPKRVDLDLGL